MNDPIKLCEGNKIRSIWDNEKEQWYFSIVDIVGVLTESNNPRRYWSDLKRKLKDEEGANELYEKIVRLKLESSDGKNTILTSLTCRASSVLFNPYPHQKLNHLRC